MQMSGNTILITGGGSGIGRALAEALQSEGNQIIVAGRRKKVLEETLAANPNMKTVELDVASAESIRSSAIRIKSDFPNLNAVIHNAGIMRPENLRKGETADAEATIATNLLGMIRLNSALLPHLLSKPYAAIMTVSSGLAFVPLSLTPTYCATKAAVHSYTQSLRYQLQGTPIDVLELIPPYVQTELMGQGQANDPNAMPLKEFIDETMNILKSDPHVKEICVERVKPLRYAERNGNYDEFFRQFNDRATTNHTTL
jgi:uncharacterized oxidoreductase